MKCVIIDDEPLAVEVIVSYLQQIEGIEVVATSNNPVEAISLLTKHHADLVFLDIEMPHLSGIDLVKTLDKPPQFIFTTAYPEYALDGFNLNATDYLVKPIPFHRFFKSVVRAKEKHEMEQRKALVAPPKGMPADTAKNDFIFVRSEYENIKLNIGDIKYIQGLKDYLKIYTARVDKAILTLLNFKEIEEKISDDQFLRVHRSYLVNISFIDAIQKSKIIVGKTRIPIGETYKKEVLNRLKI